MHPAAHQMTAGCGVILSYFCSAGQTFFLQNLRVSFFTFLRNFHRQFIVVLTSCFRKCLGSYRFRFQLRCLDRNLFQVLTAKERFLSNLRDIFADYNRFQFFVVFERIVGNGCHFMTHAIYNDCIRHCHRLFIWRCEIFYRLSRLDNTAGFSCGRITRNGICPQSILLAAGITGYMVPLTVCAGS